ncbi:HalOD1 output domain-containing protein [Halorussus salinus]|uniref:HalOD1 output domain-containing protein n=1 Tax=Halorussus salinus TaxID=1364935 RepID=UPI001092CCD0|nr:HalOD1 output domain-containing protein [Halorussus salinus]
MHEPDSFTATAVDPGDHSQTVHSAFNDPEDDEPFVQTVLDALAEASDRPVDELSVRLYDVVDPDALNDLFRPTRRGSVRDGGRVAFALGEFAVELHASGHVFVRKTH